MDIRKIKFIAMLSALFFLTTTAWTQTTVFTYQGKLTDNGTPQAIYQMEFKLFGSAGGNDQIGATVTNTNVAVMNGVFTANLEFGETAFPGADRFLQISVRRSAAESFVTLNPRQQIASSPYSIRTLSAAQADISLDSNKLGGIAASEYVTTSSVGNAFIKNDAAQQTANFNISGNGTLGGILQANEVKAQTGTGFYGLTQTDGTTTVSTYVGGSSSGAAGGWFGTQSNSPLHFFTNSGQPQMTILQNGYVGIGTFNPQANLHVAGNAVQDRANGGFAKAMLFVAANGTIVRCYNGVTGASAGNCGFTVALGSSGSYRVNFGFQVSDRFVSVTAQSRSQIGSPTFNFGANFSLSTLPNSNPQEVFIDTFRAESGERVDAAFTLIVF